MSVDRLFAELEQRRLLPEQRLAKLRENVNGSERPLSARAVAKFLVQKKIVSQQQAADVLKALAGRGVDIDSTEKIEIVSAQDLADEDEPEGSSIFAPFLSGTKTARGDASAQPDDELTLVSLGDDENGDDDAPLEPVTDFEPEGAPPALGVVGEDLLSPSIDSEPTKIRKKSRRLVEGIAEQPAKGGRADTDEIGDTEAAPPRKGRSARKKKSKPTLKRKQWDSPLILYGGGGLALMLLIGAAIWWLMIREKGDHALTLARAALNSGAFPQAIEHYERFLKSSPSHPEHSLARVQLGLTKIRQAAESGNFSAALELARTELEAIEDEESFDKAQGDLAALLPQIASGLAGQAEAADAGGENVEKLITDTNTAIELANNTQYVPEKLRDVGQLNVIGEKLRRVVHREKSHEALHAALEAMTESIDSGDTTAAFTAHSRLLKEHSHLSGNTQLAEMIQKATAAEQAAIRFVGDEQAAETTERPTPWIAALALARRNTSAGAAPARTATGTACVRVDGAVYGLDAASGKLLWRRHVGFGNESWPLLVERDVLVTNAQQQELMRLEAATGKLLWRQAIGEPFAEPLLVGNRAFISAESGRLYVVDTTSGARMGYLEFPSNLRTRPVVDRRQERLYLAGDSFTLYSISLADLACIGVYFLGHESGSIKVPPAYVLNRLAVLENDGVETSRLHLLSLNDKGAVTASETRQRLAGLVTSPLLVEGRRLIVVTDRGQFDVFEVGAGKGADALAQLARREATDRQPIVRFAAVAEGNIWVGDVQLTKFSILPTGDRLPVQAIENNFPNSAFDHPLELIGNTLIHVRRSKGRAGVVVAASDTAQGRVVWETDLAVPPASAPVVDPSGKALAVADANGNMFCFDEASIRSRVQDEPLAARPRPPRVTPLSGGVDLGQGSAAYFATDSDQVLLYDPAQTDAVAKWIQLQGPLACAATPFAEGMLAPLSIGQVFYLGPTGESLAAPFQPMLQPRSTVTYRAAGVVNEQQFVISDSQEKIYLVSLKANPQPHLATIAEAKIAPHQITSPVAVVGELAVAGSEAGQLVRFRLPTLEPAGEVNLSGAVVWGPYRVGQQVLLSTADEKLVAVSETGEIAWTVALENGDLAGPPLAANGGVLLSYRKGILERRNLADGAVAGQRNVEQPLAAGPVAFHGRLVLAASDGTLLVVDQP